MAVASTSSPSSDHEQLSALLEVGEVLGSAANFEQALYEILEVLHQRLQMRLGTLSLLEGDREVAIDIAYGLSQDEIDRGRYKVGEGITGRVVESAKPVIVPRISSEPLFLDRTQARTTDEKSHTSFVCVPITLERQVVGTLSADCPYVDDARLQANVRLLTIVAAMVAQNVASRRRAREEWASLLDENQRLQTELKERFHPTNIIGNSRPMEEMGSLIGRVAPSDATALLRGESGTGKELVAEAIHYHSLRSGRPFVKVHVAALPETLVEAELFGHEKGAFTGATEAKEGRFERADGGTLFLDEIGELPLSVQVKLLRVLQSRQVERLGSGDSRYVDVRIIAATHVNLEEAVKEGTFREDLYYRLNVFPIFVPPLRERKSDILLLADAFLDKYGRKHGKQMRRISTPAIDMLMSYHWPGNVRELENCIERAVILSVDGVVHGHHLPPSLQTAASSGTDLSGSLEMMMSSYEREILVEALKNTKGNMARAARLLGTTPRIFTYRVKRLGVDPKQYRK
jgi:Nif-specific regulatory protein